MSKSQLHRTLLQESFCCQSFRCQLPHSAALCRTAKSAPLLELVPRVCLWLDSSLPSNLPPSLLPLLTLSSHGVAPAGCSLCLPSDFCDFIHEVHVALWGGVHERVHHATGGKRSILDVFSNHFWSCFLRTCSSWLQLHCRARKPQALCLCFPSSGWQAWAHELSFYLGAGDRTQVLVHKYFTDCITLPPFKWLLRTVLKCHTFSLTLKLIWQWLIYIF